MIRVSCQLCSLIALNRRGIMTLIHIYVDVTEPSAEFHIRWIYPHLKHIRERWSWYRLADTYNANIGKTMSWPSFPTQWQFADKDDKFIVDKANGFHTTWCTIWAIMYIRLPLDSSLHRKKVIYKNDISNISMASCQKGPTRYAYAWQIGPFWQDTLDMLMAPLLTWPLWFHNWSDFRTFICYYGHRPILLTLCIAFCDYGKILRPVVYIRYVP